MSWWDAIEIISSKLLDTFNGNPDEEWWSKIITQKRHISLSQKILLNFLPFDCKYAFFAHLPYFRTPVYVPNGATLIHYPFAKWFPDRWAPNV